MNNKLSGTQIVYAAAGVIFAALAASLFILGCTAPGRAGDITPPSPIILSTGYGSTPGSVNVSWADPPEADFSHVILYWVPADGNQRPPLRVEKEIENVTITGLSSAPYGFTAVTVDTSGNISATSERAIALTDIASPSVVKLAATALMGGAAELTWTDPPTRDLSHINLTWTPPGGDMTQPLRINPGEESAVITGLADSTEYTFTAVSYDRSGNWSGNSDPASIIADALPPGAVTGLTAATGPNSSIELTWTPSVSDDVSYLSITWTPQSDRGQQQPLLVDNTQQAVTFARLAPLGRYDFTVEAVDRVGYSVTTSAAGIATSDTAPPAVVTLTGAARANNGARITWSDPVDDDFSHIFLSWVSPGLGGGEDKTDMLRIDRGREYADISGLVEGTEYTFTAVSYDALGNESAASTAVRVIADASVSPVTDLLVLTGINNATLSWTDPPDNDFSHVNITWTPEGGDQPQPFRVAQNVGATKLTTLVSTVKYTITVTSVDNLGHQAEVTTSVTPTIPVTAAVTNAAATTITAAGTATVTWTDPDPTTDIVRLSITRTPASATTTEVALGTQTATLAGLIPGVDNFISIRTLNNANTVTSEVTAVARAATARPVALFRLGGNGAAYQGGFGFEACNTALTTGTGVIPTALRGAGYTEAVFFGSKTNAPTYSFVDLATDTDALGLRDASSVDLENRPVAVYRDATPITTFGTDDVTRTIGNVVNVTPGGGVWRNGGYDVVSRLTTNFWSFTANGGISDHHCNHATGGAAGTVGDNNAVDANATGAVFSAGCGFRFPVLCAAH